ncbi:aminotransferase [Methylobacterium durans]|uniref:aminotransferase n=1 Tax=Methylobacterium durans TaxID=2202825 RepID=UPI002AFEF89B|nr:aminotransferase [Methylobacterium durans]MEA1832547.1 aminotransferase [Methylobacterium durans]
MDKWLEAHGTVEQNYGHLLLEQKSKIGQDLVDALRPYFESAHSDARDHFHTQIGISLHPDAVDGPLPVSYPNCLPSKAHRGLFGEVVAGLVTQAYQKEFVGGHEWCVPIFLFREHDDVEKYLWALRFDPTRTREVYGRHGSDFIGIALNAQGEVSRVIAGEAKWRASLTGSVVESLLFGPKEEDENTGEMVRNGRGIWFEVNRDTPVPHGLRQLQRLLEQRDPDGHANAILSIDLAVFGQGPLPGRTNLVLLVGNGAKRREYLDCLIPWEEAPKEYTAPHDLQVVEIILDGGDLLIDKLYASLWQAA